MTDTMTSQNIDLSSWDTLYKLKPQFGPAFVYGSGCAHYSLISLVVFVGFQQLVPIL